MDNSESLTGKILIVDDEVRNLKIIEELLEDFEVETARGGEEALGVMPSFLPDVVLLDIMMPGLDGYEVCRRIRQQPQFRFTKIIFVSGKAMIEERLAGYEAGADDYVPKPFDHDELLAKLRVFLRLKSVEEVSQIKTDFLTFISTETLKPLSSLLELSNMIALDAKLKREEVVDCAERISAYGRKLLTFMERTLRLCANRAQISFQPTSHSLKKLVLKAVENLGQVGHRGVEFDIDLEDEIISCDVPLLEKAFEYVLESASSSVVKGGSVRVRGTKADRNFVVSVSRDGAVLPGTEDSQGRFRKKDTEFHTHWRGLSLGVAQRIAELHRGSLCVKRDADGHAWDTTFTFRLPVSQSFRTKPASNSSELSGTSSRT